MNRLCRIVLVLTPMAGIAGCWLDPQALEAVLPQIVAEQCAALSQSTVLPDTFPTELAAVRTDPARFGIEDHPLREVLIGTVIDDLSNLDGCWGRYFIEIRDDPETGEPVQTEYVEALKFDLAAGVVSLQRLFKLPPINDRAPAIVGDHLNSDTPFLVVEDYRLTILGDHLLRFEGISAQGAAVQEDGRLVFDCLAAFISSINQDATFGVMATVQGDFLKYGEGSSDPEKIVPSSVEEYASLWVRFDCP